MKPSWCHRHLVRPMTANPYSTAEGLRMLLRFLTGGSLDNPHGLQFVPKRTRLNEIDPKITLGFAGDAMSMWERHLQFDSSVVKFFEPCDKVLLNFEGVITEREQISPDQKHTRPVLDALAQMAPKSKLVLSMANNHTADFGEKECRRCLALLTREGFDYFGVSDKPFIDLSPDVRAITGTQWSNRKGNHIAWLDGVEQYRRTGGLNVLFPHWGYEMDLYPRKSVVEQMGTWLTQFDAVVGHHSHNPQPVTVQADPDGIKRLGAYSMGNLSFGMAFRDRLIFKYLTWGAILKITAGPLLSQPDRWAVGDLSWEFIECTEMPNKAGFEVRTVDNCVLYPPERIPASA
jgi:Bacterial capsule synthesis protein PGA_cap